MYLKVCLRGSTFCGETPSVCVTVFVLLLLRHSLSSAIDTERRQSFSHMRLGDLNIGYLNSIHEISSKTRKCDVLRLNNVICFESVSMAIEEINRRSDLLPNITLGFVAMDDCHNDITALQMAVRMMMRYSSAPHGRLNNISNLCESPDDTLEILGVIGPATSRSAVMVAPYFGVFQIPTLSLSATSDVLSDKS